MVPPIEWVIFLISFVATLMAALKGAKPKLTLLLLLIIGSTIAGIILNFVYSFIAQTAFSITVKDFVNYLFTAFIGAIIVPIANWLMSIKVE
ncbi:MAG: hypothetical protein NZ932_04015 [Candidatus Bathyarchaeota archaeon]|nr:hypothetical protein [Candidatus Bathyarchaeota archaeon]MDW8022365.1 hypothetical protein [Nitrososphaerota archaeon]